MEIVGELARGPCHARAIARKLGTNHMTAARKLRELMSENVADYTEEGKNKVYFLKNSLEAKSFVFMHENRRLATALKRYPVLRAVAEKVRNDRSIRLAVLFGSYAKNTARPDSDIDVYVETEDRETKRALDMLNTKLSIKMGKFDASSPLAAEIIKNHVILKGVEDFYEKTGFFGQAGGQRQNMPR